MEEEKVRRPPTKETRNSRWRKRRRQIGVLGGQTTATHATKNERGGHVNTR